METHGTWDTFPVTGDYAQAIPGDHMEWQPTVA